MQKKSSRVLISLECLNCRLDSSEKGVSVYLTTKNKKNVVQKLELNKYCKFCGQHQLHKEIK